MSITLRDEFIVIINIFLTINKYFCLITHNKFLVKKMLSNRD